MFVHTVSYVLYRQLYLIRTDVDTKYLSGLGRIRIIYIGIMCIGRDWDLPICLVKTKFRITHVRIKQSCLYTQHCSIKCLRYSERDLCSLLGITVHAKYILCT